MFGILVGAEKARVHHAVPRPRQFSEALVDIYRIRIPDLTLMDAVVGMEGNGPSGKDLRPIGKILASRNGVSLDGLMTAMMGIPPRKVDHLAIASQKGLGEIDPARMEVRGPWEPLRKFKTPVSFASQGWFGTALNRLLYRPLIKPKLKVRPDLCTRCEVCIQHCPAQALSLQEVPRLDEKKCIACYCCYELCPNQAMELTSWMRWTNPRNKTPKEKTHSA
jgi:ferredoxin